MLRKNTIIITIASILINLTPPSTGTDPTIHIGSTKITGERVRIHGTEVNQFLGIPYAEPPTGHLRFKPTRPLRKLPKSINAKKQPPACTQYTDRPFPWYANTTDQSEDCLYLNIWSPAAPGDSGKAVMFWIHGGEFKMGSIRQEFYSGEVVAALGEVVVVGVNYRVGSFGFLTSGTKDAPGNAGIWDMLEALRWVHRHIGAFGGNPRRVTLAGESAGAMSVGLLSGSPLARGLFARGILQSGVPDSIHPTSRWQNREMAQDLAVRAGCADRVKSIYLHPRKVMRCLRDVNATLLSRLEDELTPKNLLTFAPFYGDKILPGKPISKCVAGELLIGVNKDEGTLMSTNYPSLFGFFGNQEPQLNKSYGAHLMGETFEALRPLLGPIRNHYLNRTLAEDDSETVRDQLYTSLADIVFVCPSVTYAEACDRQGTDVYFYQWVHRSSDSPWGPKWAVAHFTEVKFVFGQPLMHPERYEPEEVDISREMVKMWSEFVKSGKPDESWPHYSKDKLAQPIFRYIGGGKGTEYNYGPEFENCNFLRPFLQKS